MKMNGKTIIGIILILFGLSLFFGGGSFGGLISIAISAALLYYGAKRWSGGHKISGIILILFGICFLTGSLPFILGLALAAGLIYFGWKMIKDEPNDSDPIIHTHKEDPAYTSSFDSEWEEFLEKNK